MERILAAGSIDELNDLIERDGPILEKMALKGAGNTPLHVACLASRLDLVRVLLKWRPKFAEKVNADGFSPLHIAAAKGDVEIARELLGVYPHLCSVKGVERRIPLYYAIVHGELDVMKELLLASPESVQETTAQEETVLHLAVKYNRVAAVHALVEHMKDYNCASVIDQKDNEGNTALHLAVAAQNFEVVNFMLHQPHVVVDVNACDKNGRTPLDLSRREVIRSILTRAGARHGTLNRRRYSEGDIRDTLIVAALIASITYQTLRYLFSNNGMVKNGYEKETFILSLILSLLSFLIVFFFFLQK